MLTRAHLESGKCRTEAHIFCPLVLSFLTPLPFKVSGAMVLRDQTPEAKDHSKATLSPTLTMVFRSPITSMTAAT